jgi:hypothetical protein
MNQQMPPASIFLGKKPTIDRYRYIERNPNIAILQYAKISQQFYDPKNL